MEQTVLSDTRDCCSGRDHRANRGSSSQLAAAEVMESAMGDSPESSEDLTVKKKSKFKILKTRLFGRLKWRGTGGSIKQSQSASDITASEDVKAGYDSEKFMYSQGTLSSRALSHDSIFFSSQPQASDEPERVASQENVHGRVKALQTKLLQQNMRFGPPSVTVLTQRMDDTGASSEDDGLPRSPPDISLLEGLKYPDPHRHLSSLSLAGTGSEEEEQGPAPSSSHLVSPLIRSPSQPTSPPVLPSTHISSPAADFDSPAQFVPCLDNSAARHRMSVKPRNQRASAKGRRATSQSVHRFRSESLNDLECPVPEKKEEESLKREEFHKEIVRCRSYSTQVRWSGEGSTSAEVKNFLTVAVPSAEQEIRGGSDTELLKNDGILQEQPPSIARPLEPMGCVTSNPVFLQPVPVTLEPSQAGELNPGTVTVSPVPVLAEPQKPQSAVQEAVGNRPLSPTQPRGTKDFIKEIMQNSSQKYPVSYTTPPKSCVLEHYCSKEGQMSSGESVPPNSRDVLGNDFWDMTQAVQTDPPLNHPSVAVPSAKKFLQPGDRLKTSPLKRNTAVLEEATMQENSTTHLVQQTVMPLSGPSDQKNIEAVKHRQQRPNSGSFKFSVSSAWDRPRASSFTGCAEQTGPKNEEKLSFSHKVQERLLAKQEPPLTLLSMKSEGSPIVQKPPNPKLYPQSVGSLETAKVKDLPWTPETRSTLKRGDTASRRVKEETGAVKPVQILGNAGGRKNIQENDLNSKPETAEEDPELRNSFGVKLRSTSLSLKYRSDVAQSEMMSKRHSAEVCPPASPQGLQAFPLSPAPVRPGGSQPPTDKHGESTLFMENLTAKPPLPKKTPSKNSDSLGSSVIFSLASSTSAGREREKNCLINAGDDFETPADPDRGPIPKPPVPPTKEVEPTSSEPAWMTMAREKTRSLQQLFTSKLVPMASSQASPQPVPCDREEYKPMSWFLQDKPVRTDIMEGNMDTTPLTKVKSILMPRKEGVPPDIKANPAQQTEPGKTFSVPVISHKPPDDVEYEVKTDGSSPMSIRPPASTRTTFSSQTLNEDRGQKKSEPLLSLLSSTSMSPTTAAEQPISRHAQPSWLELAKRKSLAWSDKAMD